MAVGERKGKWRPYLVASIMMQRVPMDGK
jgi:hypothetical protein